MAGSKRTKKTKGVDPTWPEKDHPVNELISDIQGAHSPFGDLEFPLKPEDLPYEHPTTVINR